MNIIHELIKAGLHDALKTCRHILSYNNFDMHPNDKANIELIDLYFKSYDRIMNKIEDLCAHCEITKILVIEEDIFTANVLVRCTRNYERQTHDYPGLDETKIEILDFKITL